MLTPDLRPIREMIIDRIQKIYLLQCNKSFQVRLRKIDH